MGKDFNDVALGILENPVKPGDNWPEPEPLTKQDDPIPYPIEALPAGILAAVEEVLGFTQTPPALAACSALSALSLAGQGLADVRRDEGLEGPVSLFLLVLAESGERKSSVDGHFIGGIREWEQAEKKKAAPLIKEYLADHAAWEAERDGLVAKIKANAKSNKETAQLKAQLRDHEQTMPEAPRYPRLTHENTTPESLAWDLATKWPSGGIMSSEAGIVFGGHANGKDSITRNLAQLNKLWDGGSLPVSRRTSESFVVHGARLTMGLATQPATIREFYEASRGLARGSGFSARFLLASPESTQGFRPWKDAPPSWPHLTRFQNRLVELLDKTPPPDGDRGLKPPMMGFSSDGRTKWIAIYNAIEADLAPGRDLDDLKDIASKAADNIARMAALFTLYEGGEMIGAEGVQRASRIVIWHMHEAKRFFGELKADPQDILAAKLDRWLLDQKRDRIPMSEIQKSGPNALRKKESLEPILGRLAGLNRVRIVREGKGQGVQLNPALLEGGKP